MMLWGRWACGPHIRDKGGCSVRGESARWQSGVSGLVCHAAGAKVGAGVSKAGLDVMEMMECGIFPILTIGNAVVSFAIMIWGRWACVQ